MPCALDACVIDPLCNEVPGIGRPELRPTCLRWSRWATCILSADTLYDSGMTAYGKRKSGSTLSSPARMSRWTPLGITGTTLENIKANSIGPSERLRLMPAGRRPK